MEDLKTLKHHFIDPNIPLYLIAELNKMKINSKDLNKVFITYIKDILALLKLIEILRFESDRKQIRGPLRTLILKRLETLNEGDLIQYFGEPEFRFKITLNELVRLTRPKFNNPHIKIALQWLDKKIYDKNIFEKHFPNLFYIDRLIHESNKVKAEQLLEKYRGRYFPIRDFLSAIDERLAKKASQKVSKSEYLDQITKLLPFAAYFADKFSPQLLRYLPFTGLYISPVIFSVPVVMGLSMLLAAYIIFKKKYNNILFIDISGSNVEEYNSIIENDTGLSYTLLDKLMASFSLIDPNYLSCDLYTFDIRSYRSDWQKDIVYFDEKKLCDFLTPFKKLNKLGKPYDNIFILTNYAISYSCFSYWDTYLKENNPSAKLFLIQHDPYNFKDIKLPRNFYRIMGVNEKSILCIRNIIEYC